MGFFSGFSSFFSSVASTVSSAYNACKSVVGSAMGWLADVGEKVYETGKKIWQAVKPYISVARKVLLVVANSTNIPWIKVLALGTERVLAYLDNIENEAWVVKIKNIIEKGIKHARKVKELLLSEQEEQELENEKRELERAKAKIEQGVGTEEELENINVHILIKDYVIIHSKINRILKEDKINNFEHYLRFCAAQKLMDKYESKMSDVITLDEIDEDIFFIVDVAKKLLVNPESISQEETRKLDSLTTRLFGKPILPFVFEEMIVAWDLKYKELDKEWNELNRTIAKDKVLFKRLEIAKKTEPLEAEEQMLYTNLTKELPAAMNKLSQLEDNCREKRNYVYAAEGLLQFLEKDEETLIDEGKDYLIERGAEVGQLLIRCSQQELSWTTLDEDQQALIIDFANIFEKDCEARTAKLVEVAA